jgi:UDP-glucuronate 4-epimerase
MRYVITGGAGFIGSMIAELLILDGESVLIVDKLDDLLYSSETKSNRIDRLRDLGDFTFVRKDLNDPDTHALLNKNDTVIHCAGLPGQLLSWEHLRSYSEANLHATDNLAKAALHSGVSRIVFSSTSSVYGKFADPLNSPKFEPYSPYGVTKLAAEHLLNCYSQNFGLDVVVLRYFSVYGPGQRPDMAIQIFLESILGGHTIQIHGDGTQIRDFTFVRDCARGTIDAAKGGVSGKTYDISGGTKYSVNEVLEVCQQVTGVSARIEYSNRTIGDQEVTSGDTSAAKLDFNFLPSTSLFAGISAQWQEILRRNNP